MIGWHQEIRIYFSWDPASAVNTFDEQQNKCRMKKRYIAVHNSKLLKRPKCKYSVKKAPGKNQGAFLQG
jgi:hypothetical protein